MPQELSEKIQACYRRARDAKNKADRTDDPARKAEFLDMEEQWLALAQSYEVSEGLSRFADRPRELDEEARERPDDALRLHRIIKEGNVGALFERMWLASIVESSDDAIISKNLDGIITSWNKGAERLYGYVVDEVVGKPITILIPRERHHEEDAILERIRRGERVDHYETVRRCKNGALIEVSLTVSPIRGAGGKIVGASKVARDITERKRAEAQIAVLAREAEHRAKNLLANVRAMVHLSQADTAEGLKEAIEGRIEALANVHSLFVQSRWMGAELGSLVKQELLPYSRTGQTRTETDGPAAMLTPDVAQTMAVVLHELATNAAKYGALSVDTGRVRVEWWQAADADGQLVLRWTETGGPPVSPPKRKGFGSNVMETIVRGQLGGTVRLDWRVEGLVCEINVPT